MFSGRLLAGEEYRLVVGQVHPQELLLLQRLHQRRLRGTNGKVQYWPALMVIAAHFQSYKQITVDTVQGCAQQSTHMLHM